MGSKNKKSAVPPPPPLSAEMLEKCLMLGALLFFLAVAVYIPVMSGGYIYDDDQLLTKNQVIQRGHGFIDPESWRGLATIWYPKDKTDSADYFPITSTGFWIEWRLWGNNEPDTMPQDRSIIGRSGYHTVNIILHGICAVLLWMVLMRLGIPGAWFAAAIWAVHPVCAESVAWISELKNTLSMLFFLWGMFFWLKFRKTGRGKDYAITFLLILIAMLAKTAIVMVPFMMLLHYWWESGWSVKLNPREVAEFVISQVLIGAACALLYVFKLAWDMGGIYFPTGDTQLGNAKVDVFSHTGGISVLLLFAVIMVPLIVFMLRQVYPRLAPMWREIVDFEAALLVFVLWCACAYVLWFTASGSSAALTITCFVIFVTPVLALAVWWIFKRLSPMWRQVYPYFALSFVLGIITIIFQIQRAIAEEHIPMGNMIERLAGASFSLGFYVYKIFVPINLSLMYPQWHKIPPHFLESLSPGSVGSILPDNMHVGFWYLALLFIPGVLYVIAFAWAWMKRATWGRHFIFAVGFFVINLAPILGLMKIAYLRLTLVADHFQYTAMIGIIALVVAALDQVWRMEPRFREWLATLGGGFIVVFGVLTAQRAAIFNDPKEVWLDTLKHYPDSWQAHSHMGAILYNKGDYDGAMEHWKRCVELVPYLYEVHNNYGLVLGMKGRIDEALQQYKISVGIQGDFPMLRMNYGAALAQSGHFEEALKQYQVLVKQVPDAPMFWANEGLMYYQLHDLDDAIKCLREAVRLGPNYEDAKRNLNAMLVKRAMELEDAPPQSMPTGVPPPKINPGTPPAPVIDNKVQSGTNGPDRKK